MTHNTVSAMTMETYADCFVTSIRSLQKVVVSSMLWKARNATVFREERHNITQVFAACKASAEQWRYRFPRRKRPIVDQWCQVFESARNG